MSGPTQMYGDELARKLANALKLPVADLTTLASFPTASLVDGQLCVVGTGTATMGLYVFISTSTAATDATHQRPSDYSTGGVWGRLATVTG